MSQAKILICSDPHHFVPTSHFICRFSNGKHKDKKLVGNWKFTVRLYARLGSVAAILIWNLTKMKLDYI